MGHRFGQRVSDSFVPCVLRRIVGPERADGRTCVRRFVCVRLRESVVTFSVRAKVFRFPEQTYTESSYGYTHNPYIGRYTTYYVELAALARVVSQNSLMNIMKILMNLYELNSRIIYELYVTEISDL